MNAVKCLLLLLNCLLLGSAGARDISFGIALSPNITIPAGKSSYRFWNFANDTNLGTPSIHLKRQIKAGVAIQPFIDFLFKTKRKNLQFLIELNTGYLFRCYGLTWYGNYNNGNTYRLEVPTIMRHELLLSPLIGFKWKHLMFKGGLTLLFAIPVQSKLRYFINEQLNRELMISAKSESRQYFNLILPVSLSYEFTIGKHLSLSPLFTYAIGAYDIDSYAIGGVPRRAAFRCDYVSLGLLIGYTKAQQ